MNLQEYQIGALRTESIIEKLNLNPNYVHLLLKLFILNSEILDGLKKEVYYNKATKANENTIKNLSQMEAIIREAKYEFTNKDKHIDTSVSPRVFHGILGMATEAGELVQALSSNFEGKELDPVNVQEELGDSEWYNAILHDALNLDWTEGLERNLAKLKARYPNKFSTEDATIRDLDYERKILEGNI